MNKGSMSKGSMNKDQLQQKLLNDFQRDFPLTSRPYAEIARRLGTSEDVVIDMLEQLNEQGSISRVGAVFPPNRIGASTLAAMSVTEDQLEAVAELVNSYSEVNHNYEREHHFNLWFVITAPNEERLGIILDDISKKTGLSVLHLPLETEFHIDLGFPMDWSR